MKVVFSGSKGDGLDLLINRSILEKSTNTITLCCLICWY